MTADDDFDVNDDEGSSGEMILPNMSDNWISFLVNKREPRILLLIITQTQKYWITIILLKPSVSKIENDDDGKRRRGL